MACVSDSSSPGRPRTPGGLRRSGFSVARRGSNSCNSIPRVDFSHHPSGYVGSVAPALIFNLSPDSVVPNHFLCSFSHRIPVGHLAPPWPPAAWRDPRWPILRWAARAFLLQHPGTPKLFFYFRSGCAPVVSPFSTRLKSSIRSGLWNVSIPAN